MSMQLLEITNKRRDIYVVNLWAHTYDCCLWIVNKIPCSHTFAKYSFFRVDVMQGVDDLVKIDEYEKTRNLNFSNCTPR